MRDKSLFWISFSDIMTSLFFIMLVLFVVSAVFFNSQLSRTGKLTVIEEQFKQIQAINESLSSLNPNYFSFDDKNKRYTLRADINFHPNEADLYELDSYTLKNLLNAGQNLYNRIKAILNENNDTYILLVIEGNTQKTCRDWQNQIGCNYIDNPDMGYFLSYQRALALYNYWNDKGLNFRSFGERCEVIIAGSGYFGLSRADSEVLNRRFTLQLTSKWTLDELADN